MNISIAAGRPLLGDHRVPGDKSISHRALIIASLAEGTSSIRGLSTAADPASTRRCVEALGVSIRLQGSEVIVDGPGRRGLCPPTTGLDAGNSGTTMRLLAGILAGQAFAATITGDESLLRRPMRRVTEPLRLMGAAVSSTDGGTGPLRFLPTPGLHGITYRPPMASAQVKSCVLLAGLYASGETVVEEPVATRDHMERMLGLTVTNQGGMRRVSVQGGFRVEPRTFNIPGDPSGAAFLVGAALLVAGSSIRLCGIGLNPGRTAFLGHLRSLGARIRIEGVDETSGEPYGDILVEQSELSGTLKLGPRDVPDVIDELPLLALTALAGGCGMEVRGAEELRAKESDRIEVLVRNMRLMGAEVESYADGFAFGSKNRLLGCEMESSGDHRIAMAFGVAGLKVRGMTILGAEHAAISFPDFWRAIGAHS